MSRFTISLIATLFLIAGTSVQADSNKQKNNGGQGQSSQQQGQSHKKNNKEYSNQKSSGKKQKSDQQDYDEDYSTQKSSGKKQKSYEQDYDEDYSDIQRVFEQSKGKSSHQSLPPGISKNLQRGKPLPPGIAKKLNPEIESLLPTYQGKEWRQVGSDAVLIDTTTSVVQEVMTDVLR